MRQCHSCISGRPFSHFTFFFFRVFFSLLILNGCSLLHGGAAIDERYRIGFGSCVKNPDTPLWHAAAKMNLSAFLLLGDNVYQGPPHYGNLPALTGLYERLFGNPWFQELRKSTSIYAIWDDHDFGSNNSDSSYSNKAASLEVFRQFFNPAPPPAAGLEDTVAQEVRLSGVQILLLDDRSFRRNVHLSDSPQMFGPEQLNWIERTLRSPSDPVVLLVNGSQWLSTAMMDSSKVFESLSQYPAEQKRVLDAIDASPAHVFLLSGDRHYAEILATPLPHKTLVEATSSPIAAPSAGSLSAGVEPLAKSMVFEKTNFGVLTVAPQESCPFVRVEIFDSLGRILLGYTPPCNSHNTADGN